MTRLGPEIPKSNSSNLTGWKEISVYLGVTVRTAQLWEKERRLPIHRYPGKRSAVFAVVEELDAWRAEDRAEPDPAESLAKPTRSRRPMLALGALAGLVALAIGWQVFDASVDGVAPAIAPRPWSAGTEFEGRPALSPDGRWMAYLVSKVAVETADLRIRSIDGIETRTLASDAFADSSLAWSPDGKQVAYVRATEGGLEIVTTDSATGQSAVFLRLEGDDRPINLIDSSFVDWGGAGIAFSARRRIGAPYYIALASPPDGQPRQITHPPDDFAGDTSPALSPDGRRIAFQRFRSLSECDIHIVDLDTGDERQVTSDNTRVWSMAWGPDGRSLIYSSSKGSGHPRLWWQSLDGGPAQPLTGPEYKAQYPAASASAALLAYERKERWSNLWRWSPSEGAEPIHESTWFDGWPSLAPDGRTVAFISQRTGTQEVWMAAPGEEPVRLTRLEGPYTDMPRWSPDGKQISFSSADAEGNRDVYIVEVASKRTRRFTDALSEEGRASWSRDGRWIYFRSDRSGERQIWKRRSDGSGEAVQVTQGGGYEAFESADGRTLYYIRSRAEAELWSVPVEGGEERRVLTGPREARWRVTNRGVVYADVSLFQLWDARTGQIETLYDLPGGRQPDYGFAVTSSADRLIWSQTDRDTSNIWLAEIGER